MLRTERVLGAKALAGDLALDFFHSASATLFLTRPIGLNDGFSAVACLRLALGIPNTVNFYFMCSAAKIKVIVHQISIPCAHPSLPTCLVAF